MASPHLNLNFCHNVSAHNCLPSELPEDVSGVRAHKPVEKILRAYCRGAEMDLNEVESLQLGRCWCNSSNPAQTSILLDSKQSVESAGLRNGDYVFVKRISSVAVKVEEERSVEVSSSITAPEPHNHPINTSSGPSRRGRPITAASRAEAIKIQSQISDLLGGSAFLSTPFFECHFGEGMGSTYWDLALSAVRVGLKIDGSSREKTGQFPSVLKDKLSQITRRRLNRNTTSPSQKWITFDDLQSAVTALRSEHGVPVLPRSSLGRRGRHSGNTAVEEESDQDESTSEDVMNDEESVAPDSSNQSQESSPKKFEPLLNKTRDYCLLRAEKISEMWGNDEWKTHRLQNGKLSPLSLVNKDLMKPLLEMARLAPGDCTSFPPLVLESLHQALTDRQSDEKAYRRSINGSPHGWPQTPVVRDALVLLKRKLNPKGFQDQSQPSISLSSLQNRTEENSDLAEDFKEVIESYLSKAAVRLDLPRSFANLEGNPEVLRHYENLREFLLS